jgi:hypothetical protein
MKQEEAYSVLDGFDIRDDAERDFIAGLLTSEQTPQFHKNCLLQAASAAPVPERNPGSAVLKQEESPGDNVLGNQPVSSDNPVPWYIYIPAYLKAVEEGDQAYAQLKGRLEAKQNKNTEKEHEAKAKKTRPVIKSTFWRAVVSPPRRSSRLRNFTAVRTNETPPRRRILRVTRERHPSPSEGRKKRKLSHRAERILGEEKDGDLKEDRPWMTRYSRVEFQAWQLLRRDLRQA